MKWLRAVKVKEDPRLPRQGAILLDIIRRLGPGRRKRAEFERAVEHAIIMGVLKTKQGPYVVKHLLPRLKKLGLVVTDVPYEPWSEERMLKYEGPEMKYFFGSGGPGPRYTGDRFMSRFHNQVWYRSELYATLRAERTKSGKRTNWDLFKEYRYNAISACDLVIVTPETDLTKATVNWSRFDPFIAMVDTMRMNEKK